MPTTPPYHEFVMRHPAFEGIPPSRVELAIADAAEMLGSVLFSAENVWRRAVMLKAAHDLTMAGFGSGMEATMAEHGLSGFSSVRDGEVSASRPINTSLNMVELDKTAYGRALRYLLRAVMPFAVVGGGEDDHPRGTPVLRRE